MKRSTIFIMLTLIIYGLLATWLFLLIVVPTNLQPLATQYRTVIDGTANSPFLYRILATGLVDLVGNHPQSDRQIAMAYVYAHALIFPLAFGTTYAALRQWIKPTGAWLAITLIVMYLPVMYRVYVTSLYLPIELGLFSLALYWRKPGWFYGLLVVLAALNRETGIILVLAFATLHYPNWRERRIQVWTLVYALLWGLIFVGLRLWRGPAPDDVPVLAAITGNFTPLHATDTLTYHAFFLPVYAAVFLSWGRLSREVKRLFRGVVVPYLLLVGIFGFWNEVRLLMPIMPLLAIALMTTLENIMNEA